MEAGKTSNTYGIFYASWKCGGNQIECAHLDDSTILIESVCSPPNSKQELSVNLGYLAEDLVKTVA